jgi:hypothetical protein
MHFTQDLRCITLVGTGLVKSKPHEKAPPRLRNDVDMLVGKDIV